MHVMQQLPRNWREADMLGAVIAEYMWELWQTDQEIPDGEKLAEAPLTPDVLQILGAAKGVTECDSDLGTVVDEVEYWTHELLHEYPHDDFDGETDGMSDCVWSVSLGAVSPGPEEAEEITKDVAAAERNCPAEEAAALAGAMWTACAGADKEKIANYILSRELPQTSPVAYGAGALLLADDYVGAVSTAVERGFGREAVVCAGALAEPLFGIPEELVDGAMDSLNYDLRQIIEDYYEFVMVQRADR